MKHFGGYYRLILGLLLVAPNLQAADWPSDQTCVRWHVSKRMFLLKEVQVDGTNCQVALKGSVNTAAPSREKTADGTEPSKPADSLVVSVSIPLDKFNSGEPERDESVTALLKTKASNILMFETDPIGSEAFSQLLEKKLSVLSGRIQIAGRWMPLKLKLSYENGFLLGKVTTSFTKLALEPPKVAGGAIAKVRDPITLWFRMPEAQLKSLWSPK